MEKHGGGVPGWILGDRKWQNYDVTEGSLFGVKTHKIVNFSALAIHWLLKMHKSSGFTVVRTKMQEF